MTALAPRPSSRPTSNPFPPLPSAPSGLRLILLNPDLQMQDLIDQVNNSEPIPAGPLTRVRFHSRAQHREAD